MSIESMIHEFADCRGRPWDNAQLLAGLCLTARKQEDNLGWKVVPNPQRSDGVFLCIDIEGKMYDDPRQGRQIPKGVMEHVHNYPWTQIPDWIARAAVAVRDSVLEERK